MALLETAENSGSVEHGKAAANSEPQQPNGTMEQTSGGLSE